MARWPGRLPSLRVSALAPISRRAEEGPLPSNPSTPTQTSGPLQLAASFAALVRKSGSGSLVDWLAKAEGAECAEMRSFAASLRQDEAAVAAALTEAWSNGPVEGHVNRLKLIKRSMYGRAGWKLLRARVRRAG